MKHLGATGSSCAGFREGLLCQVPFDFSLLLQPAPVQDAKADGVHLHCSVRNFERRAALLCLGLVVMGICFP